jgi:L-2,4-diaminobutyrate decarboxylase
VDEDFLNDRDGLRHALDLLEREFPRDTRLELPATLPEVGLRARAALDRLAPIVFGGAERLGACTAFAHMDPPTPWITWATTLWNASLN